MPTISFASSKGGAGKSTSAVLLATELAEQGGVGHDHRRRPQPARAPLEPQTGCPENLTVIGGVTEETLIDAIDEAARKTAFVIVDLEGTASVMVAHAMSRSDLVIIPTKGFRARCHRGRSRSSSSSAVRSGPLTRTIPLRRAVHPDQPGRPAPHAQKPGGRHAAAGDSGVRHGAATNATPSARFSPSAAPCPASIKSVGNMPAAINNAREFTAEVVAMLTQQQQPSGQRKAEVA